MLQAVRASDKYKSQLFLWDTESHILSLPHGKEIWFAALGDDGQFIVVGKKPKAKEQPEQK